MPEVYIQLQDDAFTVHSDEQCKSSAPVLSAVQYTQLNLAIGFCRNGSPTALIQPDDTRTVTGKLYIKPHGSTDDTATIQNFSWQVSQNADLDFTTRYTFSSVLHNSTLTTDLATVTSKAFDVEIEWQFSDEDAPHKALAFTLNIQKAVGQPGDSAPVPPAPVQRTVYVDPDYLLLQSHGYTAYGSLADAMAYVGALTVPMDADHPVIIRLGIMTDAGFQITTDLLGLYIFGTSTGTSIITSITSDGGNHALGINLAHVNIASIDVSGCTSVTWYLDMASILSYTAGTGAHNFNASTPSSLSTGTLTGAPGANFGFDGPLTVTTATCNGANNAGGTGAAGGHINCGPEVAVLNLHCNGGNGITGGNGGHIGLNARSKIIPPPNFTVTGGTGSGGTNGTAGAIGQDAAYLIPYLYSPSDPGDPPAGMAALYVVGGQLRCKIGSTVTALTP